MPIFIAIKLVIELDGSIRNQRDVKANDMARENDLKNWGCTIVRFTNKEIFSGIDKILFILKTKVEELFSKGDSSSEAGQILS